MITLGPLDSKFVEHIRHWRNDYRIYKWCRQTDPIADVAQQDWYERQAKDPTIRMYALMEADAIVGVCGLTSIDWTNRRAEFSLYIDPELHGSGLGKQALTALLNHGFKVLNLNCIWGETFQDNPAAKMFESLGFKKEGTRRQFYFREGTFINADIYSILSSEWFGGVFVRAESGIGETDFPHGTICQPEWRNVRLELR
jgi:RimJ/RimL family protein N-acetyltransferase